MHTAPDEEDFTDAAPGNEGRVPNSTGAAGHVSHIDSPAPHTVLIVEDEPIVAADIAQMLARLGYRVVGRAATGQQAVEKAAALQPDVVLMDIRLEGPMDGIGAAALIQQGRRVPIIYLSAFSDGATLARAIDTQPLAYVVKPFREDDLRVAVEVALARHRTELNMLASDEAARRDSLIDELTGLHNRRGFMAIAEQQLKLARRLRQPVLLVYADLDDLKRINDTFGHAVGDVALRDAAEILASTFREADSVARLGGDEFAVLAAGPDMSTALRLMARLETRVAESRGLRGRPFQLAMSAGYAIHELGSVCDLNALLASADAAMYHVKRVRKEGAPSGSYPRVEGT